MKEIFTNPFVLSTLLGIILLVLPSPLLKISRNKDKIEGIGEDKLINTAYKVLTHFAEGLKNSKYEGDINLISNKQIDRELEKYKISLDLRGLKSKS